ncbi:hypothetical protein HWV62_24085 [Athelia sp. TMB]|nr:hypothetical protein HWV62_44508 [Athelia sp. TMB]KAF7983124.1 hypothetical protein HWV62_24085 [Athelia sp. TMB]
MSEHEYANLAHKPYYNIKWHFPIRELENHRSDLHAEPFYQGIREHPSFYDNIAFGPFTSAQDLVKSLIDIWADPKLGIVILSMMDNSETNSHTQPLAGIIALRATSAESLSFEISVLTLPAYQRHSLSMHAVGLILQYAFAPPPIGLGLRRVDGRTAIRTDDPRSSPMARLAQKMGFRTEGVLRWTFPFPPERSGMPREGDDKRARARHGVVMSICWDDWENGGDKRVASLLQAAEHSAKL